MTYFTKLPIFSAGFRPFFILTAIIGFLQPAMWVSHYTNKLWEYQGTLLDPAVWHAHEMIFAFAAPLIVGFLLTASANWTSTSPYSGMWLISLCFFWVIERFALMMDIPPILAILLSLPFLLQFSLMLIYTIRNHWKHLRVFLPFLILFITAKFLMLFGAFTENTLYQNAGVDLSIGLVRYLLLLIIGRVLPFFTRKRLPKVEISVPSWLNYLALTPIALLCLPIFTTEWVTAGSFLFIFAFLVNLVRVLYWKPFATIKVPILFILHIGVFWILLSLLMQGLTPFIPILGFSKAGLHAFATGGLGVLAVGMMVRVTLGHTGRKIVVDRWALSIFFCVIFGAFIRVFIPIFEPAWYIKSLHHSSGWWTLAFGIFLLRYSKALFSQRPDGKAF